MASFLNSTVTDQSLALLCRHHQKAHPHVHKNIFDVAPIPQFEVKNPTHQQLGKLGKLCTVKVEKWLASRGGNTKSIRRLRGRVREMSKDELRKIYELVKPILEK